MHFRHEETPADPEASMGPEPSLVHPEPSMVHTEPSYVRTELSYIRREASAIRSEPSAVHSEPSARPARSRASSADDLLVDLEPELLRGVPIHLCLGRFGREWSQASGPGALKWRPHLSRQTTKFTYFFSHDWGTSRWLKYLTLLVYFNSWPTALVSFALGMLLGMLKLAGILTNSAWWIVAQHVSSLFVLFFWQHLREFFCPARLAFLDRLCIPQHDEEIKSRCIYGLASFLNHSDNLVVLWSPRYCSRLWCMPSWRGKVKLP